MRKFDYGFLDNGLLPANLIDITTGIYSLKTAAGERKAQYSTVFTKLESVAKVQSVKSSNAIEGIITSDERIAEIVNNSSAPLNHDEAEIAGYRDALNMIHTGYDHISFSVKDILLLHETMMTTSGDILAGKYKQSDNVIIEVDSSGNRRVRFRPTPAEETAAAMEQLELAYLDACSNSHINQLLLIPCVILDFLCIHPFRDGNGRMSRLLSLLLLYKNGFDAGKYVSFEEQINKYKDLYYDALQRSSAGWDTNSNDYFPFMQNFLSTLNMCYKELDKRFAVVHGKKVTKSARIEATVLGSLIPISKAEICAIHPDISPTTVEAVLGKMVRDGQIRRIGVSRGSRYIRID
ncbi:MAG: Fic family protein [Oscillospiraceae bacterium]|nr:Fic family protein [Oscillospiraceae bacterium]